MIINKSLFKPLFISIAAFLSLIAVATSHTALAADYSVMANGYTSTTMANNNVIVSGNNYFAPNGSTVSTTSTNTNSMYYPKVVHGLPPTVQMGNLYNQQTGVTSGVTVYSQNETPADFKTTICVLDTTNGTTYQAGCVPEAPFTNAANGPARFDFNAWPVPTSGQHSLTFTYRDASGNWRPIQTPTGQNQYVNLSI